MEKGIDGPCMFSHISLKIQLEKKKKKSKYFYKNIVKVSKNISLPPSSFPVTQVSFPLKRKKMVIQDFLVYWLDKNL